MLEAFDMFLNRLGATVAFMQQNFYDPGTPLLHKCDKMMSTR